MRLFLFALALLFVTSSGVCAGSGDGRGVVRLGDADGGHAAFPHHRHEWGDVLGACFERDVWNPGGKAVAKARAGAEEVKRRTFLTLLASAVSERALAQATVVSSCGSVTLSAGTPHNVTIDVNGQSCQCGASGGAPTSVWSASDAAANGMTLSNGGLTVTTTAASIGCRYGLQAANHPVIVCRILDERSVSGSDAMVGLAKYWV